MQLKWPFSPNWGTTAKNLTEGSSKVDSMFPLYSQIGFGKSLVKH